MNTAFREAVEKQYAKLSQDVRNIEAAWKNRQLDRRLAVNQIVGLRAKLRNLIGLLYSNNEAEMNIRTAWVDRCLNTIEGRQRDLTNG